MLIDSHCHIDLPAFDKDRHEVMAAAWDEGVSKMMLPGLFPEQWQGLSSLKQVASEHTPQAIDIAFGFHPYYLHELDSENTSDLLSGLERVCTEQQGSIVAIGECGLDRAIAYPLHRQIEFFLGQIEIASKLNKPLVLHHRQSHNELIRLLKQERFSGGGLLHAFSGSYELAKSYIDMGFALGIGGTITYSRAKKTRCALTKVYSKFSLSHFLLETDAPDMPLSGFQGERNSPDKIPLVAKALADLLDVDYSLIAEETTSNYNRLFSSPTS
ncbi:TatD family hydrolase [Agaribacter flavus]|uniref:TatD family hydrolase n=1 Tax=Agaribacter flavus TaxID=1902781 RepID=A0ABV7FUE1_9ALTE